MVLGRQESFTSYNVLVYIYDISSAYSTYNEQSQVIGQNDWMKKKKNTSLIIHLSARHCRRKAVKVPSNKQTNKQTTLHFLTQSFILF